MKKSGKKFGAILALMLGVALGLAGCGEDAREETYRFENYSESVVAEIGREFAVPEVTLTNGELAEKVTVTQGERTIVLNEGKFIPDSFGEYTIVYTFIVDGKTVEKKTTVFIEDTQGPELTVSVNSEQIVAGGEVTVVATAKDPSGECTVSLSVRDPFGKTAPIDENGKFVASLEGYWIVTATAEDPKGFKSSVSKRVLAVGEEYGVVNLFERKESVENVVTDDGNLSFVSGDYGVYEGNGALKYVADKDSSVLTFTTSAALAEKFDNLTINVLLDTFGYADFSFGVKTEEGDIALTEQRIYPDQWTQIRLSAQRIAEIAAMERVVGIYLSYSYEADSAKGEEAALYVDGVRFGYDDVYVTEGGSADLSVFESDGIYRVTIADDEGNVLSSPVVTYEETGIYTYKYVVLCENSKNTEFTRTIYVRAGTVYGVASRFDDKTDALDLSAQGMEYGISDERAVEGSAAYIKYGSSLSAAQLVFESEAFGQALSFDYIEASLYLDTVSAHKVSVNGVERTISAADGWVSVRIPLSQNEALSSVVFFVENSVNSESGSLYIDNVVFGWNAIEDGVGYEIDAHIDVEDKYTVDYSLEDTENIGIEGSVITASAAGTYTIKYTVREQGTDKYSEIYREIVVHEWPDFGDYFGGMTSGNQQSYLRAIDYDQDSLLPIQGVESGDEFDGLAYFETDCQWPLAYFDNKAFLNQLRIFDAIEIEFYYRADQAHIFYLARDKVGASNAATLQFNDTKPNQWNTLVFEKGTSAYNSLFGTAFDGDSCSSNLACFIRNTTSYNENMRVYFKAIRGVFKDNIVGTGEKTDVGLSGYVETYEVSGGTLSGTTFSAEQTGEYTVTYVFKGKGIAITRLTRTVRVVNYVILPPEDEQKSLNTQYFPIDLKATDDSGATYDTVVKVTAPDGSVVENPADGFLLSQEGEYTITYTRGQVSASYKVTAIRVVYTDMQQPSDITVGTGELIRIVGAEGTDSLGGKFNANVKVTDSAGKEIYLASDGTFFARAAGKYTVTHTLGDFIKTATLTVEEGDREVGEMFDFDRLGSSDISQLFNWGTNRGTLCSSDEYTAPASGNSLKITAANPNQGLYWYFGSNDKVSGSTLDIKDISAYDYIVIQLYVPESVVAAGVSTGVYISSWGDNGKGEIELVGGLNYVKVDSGDFLSWFGSLTEVKGYYGSSPYCYYMQLFVKDSPYVKNLEFYLLSMDAVTPESYAYGTYMEAGADQFNAQDVPSGGALPFEWTERNGETCALVTNVADDGTVSLWPGFNFTDLRILNSLRTYDQIVFRIYFETTDPAAATYPLAFYMQRNRAQKGTTYQFPGPNGGYYNGKVEHTVVIEKGSDAWNTLFGNEFVSDDDLYFFVNNPTKKMSLNISFFGFEGRMNGRTASAGQTVDLSYVAANDASVSYRVVQNGEATSGAQIDENGNFTATVAGDYTVVYTVTYDGNKQREISVPVTVSEIPYGYVSMEDPSDITLSVGEVVKIVGAEVTDTLGEKFTANVKVTDADGNVIPLSSDGTFYARIAGEYTITHSQGDLIKTSMLTIGEGSNQVAEVFDFDRLASTDVSQLFNWPSNRGSVSESNAYTAEGSGHSLKITAANPNQGLYWYFGSSYAISACTLDVKDISAYDYVVIQMYIPESVVAAGVSTGVYFTSWGDNGKGMIELVGGLNSIKILAADFATWFGDASNVKADYRGTAYCYYMQIGADAGSDYVTNLEMYILSFDAVKEGAEATAETGNA